MYIEMQEITKKITRFSLGEGVLSSIGDKVTCTFYLENGATIEANICIGNSHAYQFRFDTEEDASNALKFIKSQLSLPQARVTPPKKRDDNYLFRLVGEEQYNGFKDLANIDPAENTASLGI